MREGWCPWLEDKKGLERIGNFCGLEGQFGFISLDQNLSFNIICFSSRFLISLNNI